ncbi:MAG: DUF2505 domain-containing protein [Nocardioidaceae bacterium]
MRLTHEFRYDAPPAKVYAMLADPAFREKVCDTQGVLSRIVTVTPNGTGMEVAIDETQPATGIPSFAQKFVGDQIRIVQHESWASASGAELSVDIPGKPGSVRGNVTLVPDGDGTVQTIDAEVKVAVPFIGGTLEQLINDLLVSALKVENRVGRAYLGGVE